MFHGTGALLQFYNARVEDARAELHGEGLAGTLDLVADRYARGFLVDLFACEEDDGSKASRSKTGCERKKKSVVSHDEEDGKGRTPK